MKEFAIPFQGFYESIHDQLLDDEINQICENRDSGDINHNLSFYLLDNINWKQAHTDYAQDYTENFASELNIKGLKSVELDSPREYNFVTDRIFARCSDAEFYRMFKLVKGETLDKVCRDNLTSRSGFYSFYNPNYKTWGHWKTWDNNQLSQVVEAYVQYLDNENGAEFDEYELMESSRCNGVITDIIERNCKPDVLQRVYKIADYLTERNARR
jgi:hypothetical protein